MPLSLHAVATPLPSSFKLRVLLTVTGGVAEPVYDPGAVDVHLADYDNDPDQKIPPEFADLLRDDFRDQFRDVFALTREIIAAGRPTRWR